ncbi:MAG TPA: prepilin peptidase [Vicinamibacterales bacterium]|nr:prepilin peptidase [Vicinamibacterales bacterium]
MNSAETFIAVAVAVVACGFDLRTRRIPNVLTFGAALLAMAFNVVAHGSSGFMTASGGWLLGVVLFLPFFALGGMGAGDVKLLGAIGAWLGPETVLQVALYSVLAGGVFALVVALRTGYLRQALLNLKMLITMWLMTGLRPVEEITLAGQQNAPRLAYALPMLAGVLVTVWRQ